MGSYFLFGGDWILDQAFPPGGRYCDECGCLLNDTAGGRCPDCGGAIPPAEAAVAPVGHLPGSGLAKGGLASLQKGPANGREHATGRRDPMRRPAWEGVACLICCALTHSLFATRLSRQGIAAPADYLPLVICFAFSVGLWIAAIRDKRRWNNVPALLATTWIVINSVSLWAYIVR
jgi:hypothetical protein